ncbi:MAG: hypothetical protein ACXVCY_04295 [Pseudobdellovibrionaceae bacterium]
MGTVSYDGYSRHPYAVRQAIAPLYGDELEAFNWIIKKMSAEYPEFTRQSDLIDAGIDHGYFTIGEKGELRVNPELPE